jgi:phage baseplate assembly protein V
LDINNIFRVCEVVETDPKLCLVRVKLPDTDELVSGWLQVVQQQTLKNKNYFMPDIEELVVCIFLGYGPIAGFVIGAVYSEDVDTPPYDGQDIYYTEYDDKTLLQYDREKHEITGNIKGNVVATVDGNDGTDGTVDVTVKDAIKIKAKSLTITLDNEETIEAKEITINASADITIEAVGNINVKSTGNAVIESTGNMDVNSTGNMTLSPTAMLKIGKMTPAIPGQGPLNCFIGCLFAGPPHGGNTVV